MLVCALVFRSFRCCQCYQTIFVLVFQGDVIVAQAAVFFTAGYETSSTIMTFGLYELSFQPDLQTKLRDEIKETLVACNGELTYDNVQEMVYLNMVVQGNFICE